MRCFFCKGPAHPATGHQYTENVIACGPCYREFLPWYKARFSNPITAALYFDYTEINRRIERGQTREYKRRSKSEK